ncbi:hypothetical protein WDU94_014391 [Cyamophila willieti]
MKGQNLLYQGLMVHIIFIYLSGVTAEPFTIAAIAAGVFAMYALKPTVIKDVQNSRMLNGAFGGEACTDKFIHTNIQDLKNELNRHIHGQELAISYICGAFKNHFHNRNHNTKALTLSLHGLPGTGKTFVADILASAIFPKHRETRNSRFVHKFNSRIDFPDEAKMWQYKMQLRNKIISSVTACERSIFIFDEVDKFPEGLLDVLKPFLDNHAVFNGVPFSDTMFIFLSNAGGKAIMERFLELQKGGWVISGKSRADLKLKDFETITKSFSYNEVGGFRKSDVIGYNVIDHYIPFMPLERQHVLKCIEDEYNQVRELWRGNHVSLDEMTKYVMEGITFIPEDEKLFASSGCKRVKQKVGTYLARFDIYM